MSDPTIEAAVGGRMRATRRALDLTLQAVAERSGLSVPHIANIERGRRNPTLSTLGKIADALGVSLAELFPHVNYDQPRPALNPAEYASCPKCTNVWLRLRAGIDETGQTYDGLMLFGKHGSVEGYSGIAQCPDCLVDVDMPPPGNPPVPRLTVVGEGG
jgi:transcriptional regulator with XRE-family HTH domain